MDRSFRFPSSADGISVYAHEWVPDADTPRALMQIAHGMSEHIARYGDFARFMSDAGYLVYGIDHLGHGQTATNQDELGYFAERDGWIRLTDDMRILMDMQMARYPGVPVFLLGHSFGSFLVRSFAIRHTVSSLSGIILSGTAHQSRGSYAFGLGLFSLFRLLFGARARPAKLDHFLFGGYNRKFIPVRTPHDWLSRDSDVADAYAADPMCGFIFTASAYCDMMRLLTSITDVKEIRKMSVSLPVLFASGADDPVGASGVGVLRAARAFRDAGLVDVTVKLLPDARHEILNETNRQEIWQILLDWSGKRIG